jgi:hypothetical protein
MEVNYRNVRGSETSMRFTSFMVHGVERERMRPDGELNKIKDMRKEKRSVAMLETRRRNDCNIPPG